MNTSQKAIWGCAIVGALSYTSVIWLTYYAAAQERQGETQLVPLANAYQDAGVALAEPSLEALDEALEKSLEELGVAIDHMDGWAHSIDQGLIDRVNQQLDAIDALLKSKSDAGAQDLL